MRLLVIVVPLPSALVRLIPRSAKEQLVVDDAPRDSPTDEAAALDGDDEAAHIRDKLVGKREDRREDDEGDDERATGRAQREGRQSATNAGEFYPELGELMLVACAGASYAEEDGGGRDSLSRVGAWSGGGEEGGRGEAGERAEGSEGREEAGGVRVPGCGAEAEHAEVRRQS